MRRFADRLPVLLVVLLVFASAAATQPAPRVARIGMLCAPTCNVNLNDTFLDELRKLGWVEGANIVVERKDPDYHLDRLPALAAELVRSKPNLIVAITPQSARAAKDATSDLPIVMLFVADPVGMGLVSSLARPGGNLTGVATVAPGDFNGKTLSILREALPRAKRVAVFINPSNEAHRLMYPREAPPAAAKLGFQLDLFELHDAREIPGAVATAKDQGADALWIWGDPVLSIPPNRLPDLAAQAGLPSISFISGFAQAGGLVAYGPEFPALARRGAHYVDRILKGAKPAELPVEQPTKYPLVINLKTAKSLGLEIPASLLARADEVIE
ncbi:ABC transporter substrate-binding protein [Bradyrhizobium sp. AUGA SZCCT0222]|uniref:ABC transporter substrate-binding protein n=1 Tax=Bradyrhizobium sp. AUGA SZCCT0222 TaxID=2807668 RepID=UPI001BA87562|nr:ABC transporter substrate-binding protein [Bradyrhizobium sp. AUGA SZCCT0222]MBR1267772.1 ABC transporter substrate-binding protein [Bradyrhizobium sp. AUGA SZCCT0222]